MPIIPDHIWFDIFHSAVGTFVREDMYAYPALETLHVIGLGLLFGGIVCFDLRVLGYGKGLPLQDLGRHVLPWVWLGFVINATSGLLLFSSGAIEFSANIALKVKLVLIAISGLNAALFHWRHHRLILTSGADSAASPSMKALACTSILIWLCVILAGRMIAYVA